jgi:hypothetical protein
MKRVFTASLSLMLFLACRSAWRAPTSAIPSTVVETQADLDGDGKADFIAVVPPPAPIPMASNGMRSDMVLRLQTLKHPA